MLYYIWSIVNDVSVKSFLTRKEIKKEEKKQ